MRQPEQKLWDSFAAHVPRHCWAQRVENGVGAGMPDVLFIDREAQINVHWIELKANEKPPARGTTPLLGDAKGMRPEQVNWHIEWAMHGGTSWIVVGIGSGRGRRLALIPGHRAREVNEMSMEQMLAEFTTKEWHTVFSTIRTEV